MGEILPSGAGLGRLSYAYEPEGWNECAWRAAGAFVAVFLNYNKLTSIRRAVESTLRQDYSQLEILFMDDASTDGSAETMEEVVRAYRGPHKVSVIRNDVNRGICGQWNQVTKWSAGEWFGMFCADDCAHANRVSCASEIIARYSSLLGLSTAMDAFDGRTGKPCPLADYPSLVVEMRGHEPPAELYLRRWPTGCTSFWRRALFGRPLPSVPFDDLLIFWRLLMEASGRPEVVWVYDGTFRTVDYALGSGLWSEIRATYDRSIPWREWKRRKSLSEAKVYGRYRETWKAILREAQSWGPRGAAFAGLARRLIVKFSLKRALAALRLRMLDLLAPIGWSRGARCKSPGHDET